MFKPRLLVTTIALLAVSACGARPTPPDQDLTQGALTEVPPESFATQDVDTGEVQDGWLDRFHDHTLNELVLEGQKNNRDLAAASARLDQAAAQARQAGADLKPQVGYAMGASGAGTAAGGTSTAAGAGLTLSWELDVWGRLSAAQSASQESFASRAADYEFARQSLAASIAKAYFFSEGGTCTCGLRTFRP
jgi:multidrug efflux system outer membrane protein